MLCVCVVGWLLVREQQKSGENAEINSMEILSRDLNPFELFQDDFNIDECIDELHATIFQSQATLSLVFRFNVHELERERRCILFEADFSTSQRIDAFHVHIVYCAQHAVWSSVMI